MVQMFEKTFHLAAPVPADDRSRNFIANRVTEHGRMPGAHSDFLAHHFFDRARAFPILEKRRRPLHGQPDQKPQAVPGGGVQTRTVLMPLAAIWPKSRSTTSGAGNSWPSSSGRNVP